MGCSSEWLLRLVRDRQAELHGCHGHPLVVGDDSGQVSAELLGGRQVYSVEETQLDRKDTLADANR